MSILYANPLYETQPYDPNPAFEKQSCDMMCDHEQKLSKAYLEENERLFEQQMKCKGLRGNLTLDADALYFNTMIPVPDPKEFCGRDLIQFRAGNGVLDTPLSQMVYQTPSTITPPLGIFDGNSRFRPSRKQVEDDLQVPTNSPVGPRDHGDVYPMEKIWDERIRSFTCDEPYTCKQRNT